MGKLRLIISIFAMFLLLLPGLFAKGQEEKVEAPEEITVMVWDVNIDSSKPAVKYLEEKLNIKVNWQVLPNQEISKSIAMMIAGGGEMPDIFPARTKESPRVLAEKGIIIPFSDFMEDGKMPLTVAKLNEPRLVVARNIITDDETGKIYAMPSMYNNDIAIYYPLYIRSDWLKKVGIEKDPETVWEWRDMMRAFKDQDVNENGIADEVGWLGRSGIGFLRGLSHMFGLPTPDYSLSTVDTLYWAVINSNEVVFSPTHERFRALLEFARSLWKEGLLSPEQFNMTTEKHLSILYANCLGSRDFAPNSVPMYIRKIREVDPDAMLHAIPHPIDPRFMGPEDRKYARFGPCSNSWLLAANGKNTEAAVRFMDFIFGDEDFMMVTEYGIEGIHHEIDVDGNPYYIGEWAAMEQTDRIVAMDLEFAWLPHEYRKLGDQMAYDKDPLFDDFREFLVKIDSVLKPACHWKLTAEQNSITRAALKDVQTYIDESMTKFILGTKSFDEWDTYVAKVYAEAGEEIEAARKVYQDYFDQYVKEFY